MNIRKLVGCVGGLETLFILESEDVCTSASAPIKNFEAALRKEIKKKKSANKWHMWLQSNPAVQSMWVFGWNGMNGPPQFYIQKQISMRGMEVFAVQQT